MIEDDITVQKNDIFFQRHNNQRLNMCGLPEVTARACTLFGIMQLALTLRAVFQSAQVANCGTQFRYCVCTICKFPKLPNKKADY